MGRIPQIATVAALLLAGAAGCQTTDKAQARFTSMKHAVGVDRPEPVTEVLSFWQRRLATLSDHTRSGTMVSGLVGQVFMISATSKSAEASGDLTIAVYDTTPRPQGQGERTPGIWHFDVKTLSRLRTKDERFGPCYAIFLPWPEEWTDVTNLKIMTRYDTPGGGTLQSREVLVEIENENNKLTVEQRTFQRVGGASAVPEGPGLKDRRGVPDPFKMLAAMQPKPAGDAPAAAAKLPPPEAILRSNVPVTDANAAPARNAPPVMTPVSRTPVTQPLPAGSNTSYATEGAYAGPKPPSPLDAVGPAAPGGIQPIVIRRDQ